jgi:xanthine dehydrogenase molybdopterin-binding subunit B
MDMTAVKPEYVTQLEAVYGVASQAGLGSAVFFDNLEQAENLAHLAIAFNDPAVSELRAFNLSDGEALSGVMIAGRRGLDGGQRPMWFA